jgi:outer membrane receptor protein involved in Fe transport
MKFTLHSFTSKPCASFLISLLVAQASFAHTKQDRTISGIIITDKRESVEGATITARYSSGEKTTTSDAEGRFKIAVPDEPTLLRIEGKHIVARQRAIAAGDCAENLEIEIQYIVPPVHESVVIVAAPRDPIIDRRNEAVYSNTLFSRDDQVFHTLDAGINAGQHEGGGKSLEIRRFGFNLDHGGVNGGLKVLVDNFQQNQSTQGHGQGYLGQLKSLTPELVQGVEVLNGPFSAEYGDFSGLGVVHIRLKESLPDQLTLRLQGGSFDTFRGFIAYSPDLKNARALVAYETSRTDGPFANTLGYKRDNVTANYTRRLDEKQSLGLKLNLGRNDFTSSGQIPLDLVASRELDRFGFIDPEGGGRVRSGTGGIYYRKENESGSLFKLDGFVSRSLFDLYSNFTFFLNDRANGDEIGQHDSRLQEGVNLQYLQPYTLLGKRLLLTAGANLHANQINVGLDNTVARNPISVATRAHARVTNAAGYFQQGIDLLGGRLHFDGGLRYDYFHFDVKDKVVPSFSGSQGASRFQPKANISYTPSQRFPATVYFNYGRGIASQDARGVAQNPSGVRVSTTDFYQLGASHNLNRFSIVADLFLIDRSNEQVYIPDDGSFEFLGPSRAYGFEVKTSTKITRHLSFNGGLTRVGNAFFRGTEPRVYIDSAPHFVSNAALTLNEWRGFSTSIRYRHTSSYRLDGQDAGIRASGLDVIDFSLSKRIRSWVDFNFSVDNLADKRFYETQNFFESRIRPADPAIARIHGTPGYPVSVSVGLTFRLPGK